LLFRRFTVGLQNEQIAEQLTYEIEPREIVLFGYVYYQNCTF